MLHDWWRNCWRHVPARWHVALVAAVIGLTGCGAERYEERLAATAEYFRYRNEVDAALSSSKFQTAVVSNVRVPKPFNPIPPPEVTDEEEPPAFDPRQPDYINVELPGLDGAWRAEVDVAREDETVEGSAFLYILSNAEYWRDEEKVDQATEFNSMVANLLSSELRYRIEDNAWFDERLPVGHDYVPRKTFRAITLQPERPFDGMRKDFTLYQIVSGDNQVSILLVVPREISPRENLDERMQFFLENLEISGTRPAPSGGGDAGGAPPGPGF